GFYVFVFFELLETRPDHFASAFGRPLGGDAVAVRTTLRSSVGGREAVDADLAVDGHAPEQARGTRTPEVVLFGRELAAHAGLRKACPVGLFDTVGKFVDERVDERVRRNVVERCHTYETPVARFKRVVFHF